MKSKRSASLYTVKLKGCEMRDLGQGNANLQVGGFSCIDDTATSNPVPSFQWTVINMLG